MRPWKLAETNYAYVKDHPFEVAILPMAATEPHNFHLPYGTDTYEADVIGEAICEAAHQQGAKVVLLPTVPYGAQGNQQSFPLAMNINPSTQLAIIGDLLETLVRAGIRKVVLLNSHGGNEFKSTIRELFNKSPAHLFLINWFQLVGDVYDEIFDQREDHAGEMETSIMLEYFPHLVGKNDDGTLTADEGHAAKTRFHAVNQGWVNISRPWHLLTTNSGSGNPHAATPEKGRKLVDLLVERLSPFLVELSKSDVDERFPY